MIRPKIDNALYLFNVPRETFLIFKVLNMLLRIIVNSNLLVISL